MKVYIFLFLILIGLQMESQTSNNLYGIVRKNYFSTVVDPFDSTNTYQQFDSATVRLGYTNPTLGFISNSGTSTYAQAVNLTGAALNPYTNSFIFLGGTTINTFNLTSGAITNQVPLNNPIAASYFDNFRFNNSDSTMYGLARRNVYDPITMNTIGEVYLAKANTQTGLVTQISTVSVGFGLALAGSAIDPYQMVYYYSTGANLVGLDLYNGSIYSSVPISITNGIAFDNFTYSCADTALYGLIRQNYFSYIQDPFSPMDSIEVLDSSSIKLGRINPNTGIVSTISPISLMQGGYSLNGGSAIDPNTMTYFFSRGNSIVGVSLITGLVTSNSPFSFADGDYFDLMRNFENCISASPRRNNSITVGIKNNLKTDRFEMYPNPLTDNLIVKSTFLIKKISLISCEGKIVYQQELDSSQSTFNLSFCAPGIYIIQLFDENGQILSKKVIKN